VLTSDNDPEAAVNGLIDRVEAVLNEAHELVRRLELPQQPKESPRSGPQRVLYFTLASALAAGLICTMEDVLTVLREARQPLGPMGEEWLARQERAFRGDGS
jgi:hypothetical protein